MAHHRRKIRMADSLDRYELLIDDRLGQQIEPLIDRLRHHTLGRRGYQRLRALLVENALVQGQPDATAAALLVIQEHWRRCPLRYLPDWPPSRLRPAIDIKILPPS